MKKLILLALAVLQAALTVQAQDTFGGGRGAGGAITGAYVFNNAQFTVGSVTNVTIKSGAAVTNLQSYGTLAGLNAGLTGDLSVDGATTLGTLTAGGESLLVGPVSAFDTMSVGVSLTSPIVNTEVWVPAAGHITNVFAALSNNMTIRLGVGTNTIQTVISDPSWNDAPLRITAKTNITIRGLGWNSVVWTGSTGTMVRVAHSQDITFEDMVIEGTRAPVASLPGIAASLFCAVGPVGTNSRITFRNVWFKNHTDHGVSQQSSHFPRNSSDMVFENCRFENVGTTNSTYGCCGVGDGAAIQVSGTRTKILNCTFVSCAHSIEFEGSVNEPIRDVLIQGNHFRGPLKHAIVDLGIAAQDDVADVIIKDNFFDFDPTTYWPEYSHGISMKNGKRFSVVNNVFANGETGIYIEAVRPMDQWLIDGNTFKGMRSIPVSLWEQGGILRGVKVVNNQFDDCSYSGVRIAGGRQVDVDNNAFNRMGTNSGAAAIELLTFSASTQSNRITRNRFFVDEVASPQVSTHCVAISDSGVIATVVEGNSFAGFTTAAWTDSGTGTEFRNNWSGNTWLPGVPIQLGSSVLTNWAAAGLATFTFASPSAGQLVGFHDPDTLTNFTAGAGSGDVTAASSFGTDNRIIRSDGTGKGVQSSAVELDDSGSVSGIADLSASGAGLIGTDLVVGNDLTVINLITGAELDVDGAGDSIIEMLDADDSHHYRFTPAAVTTANIHEIKPAAAATGFYFWTVSDTTQAVSTIVGFVGTKNVVRDDSPTITNATLVTGVIIPNGTADVALGTAGGMHLNTTDEQLSFHSAADGEISGEVSLPLIQTKSWSFDPKAVCDGAVDRLFLMWIQDDAPEGIIIDEWKISFEADPTTEVDLDLKYADAMIGVAGATLVDALDTTAGTATEDTDANINGGSAIPNGKVLYLEFGTAYTEANHQIMFQIWYHVEED